MLNILFKSEIFQGLINLYRPLICCYEVGYKIYASFPADGFPWVCIKP